MTLNVGPAADGTIPLLQQERLLDLGKWLDINGDAIFDTRPLSVGQNKVAHFYDEKPMTINRHDETIDFDWVRNSPDKQINCDDFTAVWTGTFTPEKTDVYTFDVEVDDNVRVTIGDEVVIDYQKSVAEESQSNAEEAETKSLTTGRIKLKRGVSYPVKIEYQEINVNAMMRLFISGKEIGKQIFKADNGFDATYSCMKPYVCYTTKGDVLYAIAIEFPQDELILNIPEPADDVKVMMLGCDKILPWRYENGKMIIDTTPLRYSDLKSTAAWSFVIY